MAKKNSSVEAPPPRPKRPKSKDKMMGEMLADLELRAELEPYLANNPVARLGWDIITRGETPGEGRGGQMVAGLMTGPQGYTTRYNMQKNFAGFAAPSDTMNPDNRYSSVEEFQKDYPVLMEVLGKQGIGSLMPREEGSVVYYDVAKDIPTEHYLEKKKVTPEQYSSKGLSLSILMEELAHIGMRDIQRRGNLKDLPGAREELLMDHMQGRAAEKGAYATPADKEYAKYGFRKDLADKADAFALRALADRGVPSRVEAKEPTFMERFLGLFD